MLNLVVVVVTVAVAAILWRIVRWLTKQSNAATQKDLVELPADKDVAKEDTTKLQCDKKNEASGDILQLKLAQEQKLRERAEQWAEFLTCELEAHIRARIAAERRSLRLERRMNSENRKALTANNSKPVSRNFKDIGEVHETWQKMCDTEKEQWEPDCLTYKLDHDENEWHQIVDANERFLQAVDAKSKQKDDRTTRSCKTEEQYLHGYGSGDSRNEHTGKINITVEACTPGEEQKMLGKTAAAKVNDNNSFEDFTKLRLPSQDEQNFKDERMKVVKGTSNLNHETNQSDKTEIDKNPLVCTESLSNIRKTTEIWENLKSTSKEMLNLGEDLSPTSTDLDITPGLVQKNLKMYETSETVENKDKQ